MAELSRSEKIAAAQLKLKKLRESKFSGQHAVINIQKGSEPAHTAAAYFIPTGDHPNQHNFTLDFCTAAQPDVPISVQLLPQTVNDTASVHPSPLANYFGGSCEVTTPQTSTQPNSHFLIPNQDSFPCSEAVLPNAIQYGNATVDTRAMEYPAFGLVPSEQPPALQQHSNGTMPDMRQSSLNQDLTEPLETVENSPTATTEKILQLSQQLNGLLQTSEQLTTSFTSPTESFPSASGTDVQSNGLSTGAHSPESGTLERHLFKRSNTPNSTHSATVGSSYVRELEDRNVELASLLEKRSRAHERDLSKLSNLQEQYTKACSQAVTERQNLEQQANRDLSRAQEQVRAHAQTIGILVAEKTELQTKVNHFERLANERSHEIEVLDDRLQTYRKQSLDLEKSVQSMKSELDKAVQEIADLSSQLERHKLDGKRERTARENVEAELQEAYSRLSNKDHEVKQMELKVDELRRQLELVQLYANQFSMAGDHEETERGSDGTVADRLPRPTRADWQTERNNLIQRIEELENTALQANKERGRLESQYKSFVSQMEQQVVDLRSSLSEANASNQQLQIWLEDARRTVREREDELAECKSKLEIALQQSSPSIPISTATDDTRTNSGSPASVNNRIKELEELTATQQQDLQRFTEEVVILKTKLVDAESVIREKDILLADRDSVLATATSERTALSRAMEQNRTLKEQLTELQDAIVNMQNQNAQLNSDLQREQHALKESGSIQHDYRGQLERLQEHCARRENEYNALSEAFEALSRELDRAREHQECHHSMDHPHAHDEEDGHAEVASKLMRDLEESHTTIANLTARLDSFESVLHRIRLSYEWLQEQDTNEAARKNKTDREQTHQDPMELINAWDRLALHVVAQRDRDVAIQAEQNRQHQSTLQRLPSLDEWEKLRLAHSQLESKFVDCMDKLSRENEERARLETVVAQLEMEASTVGEYVTLFAHRRAAASRRAQAREDLLGRLVTDRKRLRSRLHRMQAMLSHAVKEDGSIDIESHSDLSPCDLPNTPFISEFKILLDEVNVTSAEAETEAGLSTLSDEDFEDPNMERQPEHSENSLDRTAALEKLRQQALQHDCPHCQCCVGTLLEV